MISLLKFPVIHHPLPPHNSDESLAKHFADYFISKIDKIWENFTGTPIFVPEAADTPTFWKFAPLTADQVYNLIAGMQTKSCKLDLIPTHILKWVLSVLIPLITHIVNTSLSSTCFCEEGKTSVVRPLLRKKGLDLLEKNYWPVSNLPFLSKLVEWATLAQFDQHCREHQLLPGFQLAYRKGYNTKTSLIKMTNNILWNMERKEVPAVIVLDMSTAFDTIDHNLLLYILHKRYGITDIALQWYWGYLRPQGMKVHINDAYSSSRTLNYSVPQGSASGAKLFTAYCAPIKSVIPAGIIINRFTDDHWIRKPFNADSWDQESQSILLMMDMVANIASWMDTMHLKLNPDKTEFIMFGYRNQLVKCTTSFVTISDSTIPKSPSVKYLGVTLDKNQISKSIYSLKAERQ